MKTLFKLLIVAVVLGGAMALIAGPDRVGAVVHQAHASINQVIDQNISDPIALRRQLHKLEKEYPGRISAIRGDIAELDEQKRQLQREQAIASRVVVLAEKDRADLEAQLASVDSQLKGEYAHPVSYRNTTVPAAHAQRIRSRVEQVQHTILAYSSRAQDAVRDLGYLVQQEGRLHGLLAQVEAEPAQFRAQLLQLDRQVDAVARNERLIQLMEKRQRTIEQLSRYEVGSLDHLQGRLAEIRARQEAQLEVLAAADSTTSYEDQARFEINMSAEVEPAAFDASWIQGFESAATAESTF
ncbi:MAG: hypothetical protein H8E31_03970 [Planctomycetes bacterium]|nr:hypothetical protein [Planctomycetota bacterium]